MSFVELLFVFCSLYFDFNLSVHSFYLSLTQNRTSYALTCCTEACVILQRAVKTNNTQPTDEHLPHRLPSKPTFTVLNRKAFILQSTGRERERGMRGAREENNDQSWGEIIVGEQEKYMGNGIQENKGRARLRQGEDGRGKTEIGKEGGCRYGGGWVIYDLI